MSGWAKKIAERLDKYFELKEIANKVFNQLFTEIEDAIKENKNRLIVEQTQDNDYSFMLDKWQVSFSFDELLHRTQMPIEDISKPIIEKTMRQIISGQIIKRS